MIKAAILAGGLGTRLRPAVGERPKVLARVHGRPFLSYLLEQVAAAGIQEVVLCTGYLGEQVRAEVGDQFGAVKVRYSRELEPLGTAGALRLALPLLDCDPVLVLNGDSCCRADLSAFVSWHRACAGDSAGSLVLTWVEDASRYGTVGVDGSGGIVSFREKTELAIPGWINAGVYLLSRRLLASIPADGVVSIERDVFPAWVGPQLRAYQVEVPFIDIGTPKSYADAETFFADRGVPSFPRIGDQG